MFNSPDFPLEFKKLEPWHFFDLDLQGRQRWQYGMDVQKELKPEVAAHYAEQPNMWACVRGGKPIAIMGINQTFPGVQGVAFALFGKGVSRSHHRLTRFAREVVIGQSGLRRVEAIVRCAEPPPPFDRNPFEMLHFCLDSVTPEVRWAMDVGLSPVAVLRNFGVASEAHMLLERIA